MSWLRKDRAVEPTPKIWASAPWRVLRLEALADFRLRVTFNDGTEGTVELATFLQSPDAGVFGALRDEALFRRVTIDLGAVSWPGDLDLAPDAMHREIKEHGTWIVK